MTGVGQRVLVIGDPYFTVSDFRPALTAVESSADVTYVQLDSTAAVAPATGGPLRIREYAGNPDEIAVLARDYDVLVVHGAGVSAQALTDSAIKLVCCARGGPVNVDLEAARTAGVAVCSTPGKNAEAVAELTIAFALVLIRGVTPASKQLAERAWHPTSAFDGREFFGHEASTTTLGLIGLGHVGQRVARRALRLGFEVIAHDPFVPEGRVEDVRLTLLDELLERSHVVSLHARGLPDGRPIVGEGEFSRMRRGSFLINTAREQLIDEEALIAAVKSGIIQGAALDVFELEPSARQDALFDLPQILCTPHIGGATQETLVRGATMTAQSVEAFIQGAEIPWLLVPGSRTTSDPVASETPED